MRVRFWVLITVAVLAIGLSGCAGGRIARGPANTPVPTKTLRPTFTATVPEPTLTPSPTAALPTEMPVQEQPTATSEPPTPEPSPTAEPAALTVTSASLNVRSGPGTAFAIVGRLSNGQSFPITGKNNDGSWWQFDYNGRTGWVVGSNVSVRSGDAVQVAQNIRTAPTAAPRPTARPAAPRPTAPPAQPAPAPSTGKYAASGTGRLPNTNNWVTVYCILYNKAGTGLLPGTLRVTREGQVVGTTSFTEFPTYYLSSGYNAGCKVEVQPAVNGNYTAVLVEGDQVVSDPINFTVTGEADRITFTAWKQR